MHPILLSCGIALLLNRAAASPAPHSRWRAARAGSATGDARQMSLEPLIPPDEFIRRSGGALPLAALRRAGFDGAPIRAGLRAGRLISVRRGWYAIPDAPADVTRAVRVGGALTAASAARLRNLWLLDDPLLHVRVPSSASGLRSPDDATVALDRSAHGVCVHYRTAAIGSRSRRSPCERRPREKPRRDVPLRGHGSRHDRARVGAEPAGVADAGDRVGAQARAVVGASAARPRDARQRLRARDDRATAVPPVACSRANPGAGARACVTSTFWSEIGS